MNKKLLYVKENEGCSISKNINKKPMQSLGVIPSECNGHYISPRDRQTLGMRLSFRTIVMLRSCVIAGLLNYLCNQLKNNHEIAVIY